MKKITLFVIVCLLLSAVMAQAEGLKGKSFTITPKVAMNVMLDKEALDKVGNQYGFIIDTEFNSIMPASSGVLGLEVGYFGGKAPSNVMFAGGQYASDVEFKSTSIPLLATYKYIFPNTDFYVKGAAGVAFNKMKGTIELQEEVAGIKKLYDDTKKSNNFAFELGFGAKFSNNVTAELLYVNYGKAKYGDNNDNPITINDKEDAKLSAIQFNLGYSF